MIPIGQPYRPAGKLDARSVLAATILGVVTAVLVAGLVWLWELGGVPTPLIVTPAVQGFAIGLVLAALVGRLRLRHARLLWTLGFACGLLSAGLVHYAHYLRYLDTVEAEFLASVAADPDLSPAEKRGLLAQDAGGSGAVADTLLAIETGHTGFVGFLILRTQVGFHLRGRAVRGGGVWFLFGLEALAVGGIASAMTKLRTKDPFCGDCGDWCLKQRAPVELMSGSAPALADAVLADDLDAATLALAEPVDAERHKRDAARVTLHACPHCDQAFADVEGYTIDFDGETTRTTTLGYLKLVRISPEMADLLRNPPPAVVIAADEKSDPTGDEADEVEVRQG